MVAIYVDGQDKTKQISDWRIWWDEKAEVLKLTCHYPSTKKYTRPLSVCRVEPTRELRNVLLEKQDSIVSTTVERVEIYGERYAVVYYSKDARRPYVRNLDGIRFVSPTGIKDEPVFGYFQAVANAWVDTAKTADDKQIAANVVKQLKELPVLSSSALQAYCSGSNEARLPGEGLIYPFGINESQLMAVEQAFSAQISLIEGPPGTGKTQTILNILANILLRGQTVAVLSNNNAAVENVYEKLGKSGLDYLVAKLGNRDNREDFFAQVQPVPSGEPEPAPPMEEIQAVLERLKRLLHEHNLAAQLKAEIDELNIERRYLEQWQKDNGAQPTASLARYRLSPRETTDLMAYLAHLTGQRLRLKDRFELLFKFRIFRAKPLADEEARLSFFDALQSHFYDELLRKKEDDLRTCNEALARGDFSALLEELMLGSMRMLKHRLHEQIRDSHSFDAKTYRKHFDAFVKRFPILGSSTHSIVNSIAPGAVLDYVIIDEASQQDIVPGILALGCAKNLIVVGDNKQLAHIPAATGLAAPLEPYDCERYSLLDSCMQVFGDAMPKTLLKEHYRCHPRIIQFCNQQFYADALVPMTEDNGEAPLRLVVTAKGNHARKNINLREVESLLKVLEGDGEGAWVDGDGRGLIAPFRAQATLSKAHLPDDFVTDTVHKFQGRECDEIVFSTVLDKKQYNQSQGRLSFVDDPRMVNVAVSRAKHRFTLVTGDEVFARNNGPVAALIRYIEYYAEDKEIQRAPVVSAFDLLYKEYDKSLERLRNRLRKEDSRFVSEQIMAQILREAFADDALQALKWHKEVALNKIAVAENPQLTDHERQFMRRSSCDFVIYFRVGKRPVGVIEVDGGSHDKPDQIVRDNLKNSILKKSGIDVLRVRTVDSGIEETVRDFLAQWASPESGPLVTLSGPEST
jgi:RecA/RadA recombinase|uniref:Superfamily I DNA and RNA helicase and helicase subunits-like protein n=1 Tax=Ectopseudomonas mendocina (strain ymp) TaxID=399739 RepID=A4XRD4_ECTM1